MDHDTGGMARPNYLIGLARSDRDGTFLACFDSFHSLHHGGSSRFLFS